MSVNVTKRTGRVSILSLSSITTTIDGAGCSRSSMYLFLFCTILCVTLHGKVVGACMEMGSTVDFTRVFMV